MHCNINLNYGMVSEVIELNVLSIIQFIIITILIIILMYEISKKIIIYKECDEAIEKI